LPWCYGISSRPCAGGRARSASLRPTRGPPSRSCSSAGSPAAGTSFNIVPADVSFTIDRRPNPDEDYDEAKEELLALLESARARGIDLDWQVLQDARSSVAPASGDFVQTVAAAVAAVTGARPSVTCCPGVLEIRVYNQLGVPAVAFGPGLIERMHSPGEDVPLANLVAAARVYAEVAGALAGRSRGAADLDCTG
jgi:succinyl-diaminopimelate desuccinylase